MPTKDTYIIDVKTKGTDKAKNQLGQVDGGVKKLGISSKTAKIGLAALGTAIVGAGIASIKTAGQFETLRTRLNTMYGSVNAGTSAFNAFNKVAATTPFQLQNVVAAGASLKAFGVDAKKNIKPVADLAAFMGLDVVEAASAMGRAFAGGAGAADILRERGVLELIKSFKGIDDITELTLPEFRKVMKETIEDPSAGIAGATDALAKTFEGRYSNMMDSVDRLSDAMGQKLLPVAEKVVNFFGALANTASGATSVYDEQIKSIKTSQTTMSVLVSSLRDTAEGSNLWKIQLKEIKKEYPDFLQGMKTEKVTTEDLVKLLKDYNTLSEKRISILKKEQERESILKMQQKLTDELKDSQMDFVGALVDVESLLTSVYLKSADKIDFNSQAQLGFLNSLEGTLYQLREQEAFLKSGAITPEMYYGEAKIALDEFIKGVIGLRSHSVDITPVFALDEYREDLTDFKNVLTTVFEAGIIDSEAFNKEMLKTDVMLASVNEQLGIMKLLAEGFSGEEGLGLVSTEINNFLDQLETIPERTDVVAKKGKASFQLLGSGITKQLGNASEFMGEWGPSITGAIGAIGATSAGSHEEGLKVQKAVLLANVAQGIVSVLASEGWGIKDIAKKALLTATLVAQGSTQSKAIDKQISEIQSAKSNMQGAKGGFAAQYGMSEILDQPTTILAGEAGAELVNITPLEGPNLAGPQGGISVNITGNVMTRDYVREELAEEIKEAIRQGYDFR